MVLVCQKENTHEDRPASSLGGTKRRSALFTYPVHQGLLIFISFLYFPLNKFFIKSNKLIIYYDSLQLSDMLSKDIYIMSNNKLLFYIRKIL